MRRGTKIFSLFLSLLMLCMASMMPVSAAAETPANDENYVDIEVPLVATASSPLTGTYGKFNAFFNQGQETATTNVAIFDWRDKSLPDDATVTKVEVYSIRTSVTGMTYYVQVGKGENVNSLDWAPDLLWSSTVNTTYFNNQDPHGYWAVQFYATRIITSPDYGAGATVSTATLRVYFD